MLCLIRLYTSDSGSYRPRPKPCEWPYYFFEPALKHLPAHFPAPLPRLNPGGCLKRLEIVIIYIIKWPSLFPLPPLKKVQTRNGYARSSTHAASAGDNCTHAGTETDNRIPDLGRRKPGAKLPVSRCLISRGKALRKLTPSWISYRALLTKLPCNNYMLRVQEWQVNCSCILPDFVSRREFYFLSRSIVSDIARFIKPFKLSPFASAWAFIISFWPLGISKFTRSYVEEMYWFCFAVAFLPLLLILIKSPLHRVYTHRKRCATVKMHKIYVMQLCNIPSCNRCVTGI